MFRHRTGKDTDNYLDDFFFVDLFEDWCNNQVTQFLKICDEINFPVSLEKTEWATQLIVFLGILLNAARGTLQVPLDKKLKAEAQLQRILESKKIKVIELQRLTGLLNFLCKAIFPGRAFTRRMYAKYRNLKQHHHFRVDSELRSDCLVWIQFLDHPDCTSRPFVDLNDKLVADEFLFTTDASRNKNLGIGGFIALTEVFSPVNSMKNFQEKNMLIDGLARFGTQALSLSARVALKFAN